MINFLITILQRIKEWSESSNPQSSSPSKYVAVIYYVFLSIFIGLIGLLVFLLTKVSFAGVGFANILFLLIIILLLSIGFYSLLRQGRNFLIGSLNIWQAIYTIYFPLLIILVLILSLSSFGFGAIKSLSNEIWRLQMFGLVSNNVISLMLVLIYPVLWMIGSIYPSLHIKSLYQKLISIFSGYTIGYMLVLSIAILRRMIVDSGEVIGSLDQGLIFFLLTLFFITFPLISLRYYLILRNKKGVLFYTLLFLGVTVVFTFADSVLSQIVSYPVRRSVRIIEKGGDNYDTYKKAQTLFLKNSYLALYKRGSFNQNYFKKLFDAVPESYFGSKLGDASLNNSRGTNASKVGKNADVTLKLAEIENTILSSEGEIDVLQTVYKFHMVNKVDTNQEVILQFQTPSQNSVVTDLKLGLNGELTGIVAPRGAASKVYQDSLRINRDPALLEKMGLNTYRLRVFPIPSKLDEKSQGRQLVQFTVLSPLEKATTTTYSPQLSLINLHINKETSLISKIYKGDELVHEDRVENTSIDQYLAEDHILSGSFMDSISAVPLSDYCVPNIQPPMSDAKVSFDKIGILWQVRYDTNMLESISLSRLQEEYRVNNFYGQLLCVKEHTLLQKYENGATYSPKMFKLSKHLQPASTIMSYFFADKICEEDLGSGWRFSRFYGEDIDMVKYNNMIRGETLQEQNLKILDSGITRLDISSSAPFFLGVEDPQNISRVSEIDNNFLFYPLMNNEARFSMINANKILPLNNKNQKSLNTNQKPKTKTSIFFDNSLSVKRNSISSFYAPLYDAIKNYNNKIQDVDIFSFNFFVEKLVSLKDLKFWGYSDIDGLLDYIEKNNIKNQRIIIVTDDDNFNFTEKENTNRDFSKVLTNEIHVIVLGKAVKTYKSDFMSLLAASRGTLHIVKNANQFNSVLVDIFTLPLAPLEECGSGTVLFPSKKKESQSSDVQKILAGMWSASLMSSAKNSNDWNVIAKQQTLFAQKYTIVNQFNSMIAMETEQQMRDLQKYQQQNDKYNSSYENWGNTRSSSKSKLSFSNFSDDDFGMKGSAMPSIETSVMPSATPSSDVFFGAQTATSSSFGGDGGSIRTSNPFGGDSVAIPVGSSSKSRNSYGNYSGYDSSRDINVSLWIILCILVLYGVQVHHVYLICVLLYGIYFKKSGPTSMDPSANGSNASQRVDLSNGNVSLESLLSGNQEIPKTE